MSRQVQRGLDVPRYLEFSQATIQILAGLQGRASDSRAVATAVHRVGARVAGLASSLPCECALTRMSAR